MASVSHFSCSLIDIVSFYSEFRSQTMLVASGITDHEHADHKNAGCSLQQLLHDPRVLISLRRFLVSVSSLKPDLEDEVFEFIRRFPSTLRLNQDLIIEACAKLISLNEPFEERAIWSAVANLLSAAALGVPHRHTPPLSTFSAEDTPQSNLPAPPTRSLTPLRPVGVLSSKFVTPQKSASVLTNLQSTTQDTPVRANSASLFSQSPQTHAVIDPFLRAELRNTVWKDVKGFHTFFPGPITETEWNCAIKCPPTGCTCQWSTTSTLSQSPLCPFPSEKNPSEQSVVAWFHQFNLYHLSAQPRAFANSGHKPLTDSGSPCHRRCDIFLTNTGIAKSVGTISGNVTATSYSWREVLVPGELKASNSTTPVPETIVQLAGFVREVFGAQVNRRFVHAFTLCGSFFRCVLFDRAGVSASEAFDIRKNQRTQNLFVRILLGYARMTPQELGFDPNYLCKDGLSTFMPTQLVPHPTYFTFSGRKFRLVKKLFHRPVIVSRGTTCWLASDDKNNNVSYVLKDSWRAAWRTHEGKFLEIAASRGAVDVPKSIIYGDVNLDETTTEDSTDTSNATRPDTINHLRSKLLYNSARRVEIPEKFQDGMYLLSSTTAPSHQRTEACTNANNADTTKKDPPSSSLTKRPRADQLTSEKRKLAKTSTSTKNIITTISDTTPTKLKPSASAPEPGPEETRLKTTSRSSRPHSPVDTRQISLPPSTSDCANPTWPLNVDSEATVDPALCKPEPFMHLIHSVLVLSPVGKKIEEYTCLQQLLEALRDAIRCHRDFVEKAGILHRDISSNNIMIHNSDGPDDSFNLKGFLIDLDLAKQITPAEGTQSSYPPPTARRRTGTVCFMAIEVLRTSAPHTWRHDLESFLYVLIWLCINAPADAYPDAKLVLARDWSSCNAADTKVAQMGEVHRFMGLIDMFAPSMRPLRDVVKGLRAVLFPRLKRASGFVLGRR